MSMRWIEDNPPSAHLPLWTRANVGEVAPEPVHPLGWDLVTRPGMLRGWRDCSVNRFAMADHELDRERPEVAGVFGGYMYLNASAVRLLGHRAPDMTPEAVDTAYFGAHADVPPYVHEDWHDDEALTARAGAWMAWVLTTSEQPDLEADREVAEQARAARPELTELSVEELLDRARWYVSDNRRMFDQHIHQSGAASVGPGVVAAVAEAIGDPTLTLKIIGAIGDVDSAAPSFAIWNLSRMVRASDELTTAFDAGLGEALEIIRTGHGSAIAAFRDELDEFLRRFGSRGPNEWDLIADTWETDPTLVLAMVDRMRQASDDADPKLRHAAREAERDAIVEQVATALVDDPEAHGQFLAGVSSAARFVAGRERSKTSIIKVIHEQRMAMWEVGRRLVDLGGADDHRDICMLFLDEIPQAMDDPNWSKETIVRRREWYDRLRRLEPPFIIHGECPPLDTWPERWSDEVEILASGATMQGVPGSSGRYRGRARIVLDPGDPTALEPGDVLVAPHTDPAWTPLFVTAGAVVVDVGAPLSHAIVVSRELGLPCVVSATGATRRIPDGAMIEVDGDLGTVQLL